MTESIGPTTGPVQVAASLHNLIREHIVTIDSERQLPPDLVEALRDSGLMHMNLPRSLGGEEIDPVTSARAVEEVSFADGSTGWCVMLAAQAATFAGFMPHDAALDVWANRGIAAGVARPIGRAVKTETPEPGYRVTGPWPFASGSSHADWFGTESIVYDGDEPLLDDQGEPVIESLFVPRAAVTLFDTWDTLGLRGTASNDFAVDDLFTPLTHRVRLGEPPIDPWPVYRAPGLVYINHASHALGIARAAIESAKETAANKNAWGNQQKIRDLGSFHLAVAEAVALVESSRQYLYAVTEELWQAVQRSDETPQLRARIRLAGSHAAKSSVRAVDSMHAALGTSSVFSSHPLDRQFRDIHTAAAHVMIGPLVFEAAGRVEVGLEADFPFF
jgi:alkylation response protein AidB-like acyl-CoA dehydrogenase